MSPIPNYVTPGVYVTQAPTSPFASANSEAINICFLGYSSTTPSGLWTDYATVLSGGQTIALSYLTSSGSITSITSSNGYTALSGTDYTVGSGTNNQNAPITTITLATGDATVNGLVNSQIAINYGYATATTGVFYNFYDYNSVTATFGNPWNFTASGVTVNSPVSLAAYLAFQNGAQNVTCCNITTSGGGVPTEQDYLNAIILTSGNSVYTNPDIDVIVPLTTVTSTGQLLKFLPNYLSSQAQNGIFQRSFVGIDTTVTSGTTLTAAMKGLTSAANSSRVTIAAPAALTINPGLNSTTGYSNGTVTVGGYYLAAALAGVFAGQPDVYIPITHKTVNGFAGIPNQVSPSDSQTIQAFGGTIVRQRNDGSIYVRHGLTTNTSNWMTQELSISAIGDRLSQNIQSSIDSSEIIGSALTQSTLSSLQSIVLATLTKAVNTNLIQSYQNLSYTYSNNSPTTINVSFQYSPTFPLNYVQVVMSVNAQTGTITTASNINSAVIG